MYLIVKCHKCGHVLCIEDEPSKEKIIDKIASVLDMDCPNCGEEPDENWLIYAFGKK